MLSFVDFKLKMGIDSDEKDTEYASILRGLIRELYTVYGIALDKDVNTITETITVTEFDAPIQLTYKNIVSLSIAGYVEGVDFTLDKDNGTITINSNGSMLLQDYSITYSYYVFINESNEIVLIKTPIENEVSYYIDVKPFTIKSITYNGTTLANGVNYFLLGNRIILSSPLTNLYTPLIITLTVGYDEVPYDLKQTLYELALYRMERKVAKADLISRVEDNNGTATSYRADEIPKHIKMIFMEYMGRRLTFS